MFKKSDTKKIVKTWRDQDRLINHGNLVPLSETGVRENWKTLLTLQSPREARHRGTAGSWGLELVLSTSLTRSSAISPVSPNSQNQGPGMTCQFFDSFGRNQQDRKITLICKRKKIEWFENYFKIDYTLHFSFFLSVFFFFYFKKKYFEVINLLMSNLRILSSWIYFFILLIFSLITQLMLQSDWEFHNDVGLIILVFWCRKYKNCDSKKVTNKIQIKTRN